MEKNLEETYLYKLRIIGGIQGKELSEIARQVAEILPRSHWIEGTADILLANPDYTPMKTAVNLAGGSEDFEVEYLTEPINFYRSLFMRDDDISLLLRCNDLTQQLLQVPGVPNTTYRVDSGRVFVFTALEEQVKEILRANPSGATSEVTLLALPSAWVEASVAVEQFGIVPVPYKRIEIEGKLAILHEPFNALLPPRFNTESDRNSALAQLLLGQVLAGEGEFKFQGQAMTMLEPMNLNSLLPVPSVNILELEKRGLAYYEASITYSCLGNTEYIPGFPLLDLQAFNAIKATEINWVGANMYIISLVYDEVSCIWQKITHASLDWKLLNIDYDIPNSEAKKLDKLRFAYPELANLSDEALYYSYDSYKVDCCGVLDWSVLDWSPSREDGFIFYLLGLLCIGGQADSEDASEDAEKVGKFVACQLLHNTESLALSQGKIMFEYHAALYRLARRTRKIIDFLRSTKPN